MLAVLSGNTLPFVVATDPNDDNFQVNNLSLMPQLAKCRPGTRIVSHDFDMQGAKPVVVHQMTAESDSDENAAFGPSHTIYKWVVPWEKE